MASRATPPPDAKHRLTEHVDLDADRNTLMQTTNKLTFEGRAEKRPDPRPTSNTRHNNPQPKSFRSTQLPSGRTINVSLHTDVDGRGGLPLGTRSLDFDDGFRADSTFRDSFRAPRTTPDQQGNVTRYGQNLQPWANSFRASRGIVPTVNALDLDVTSRTTPTNVDAFSSGLSFTNRFSATSSRRAPADFGPEDHDNLARVVEADALDAVESWIRTAPGFEGEVVKRMLRDVTFVLAERERKEREEQEIAEAQRAMNEKNDAPDGHARDGDGTGYNAGQDFAAEFDARAHASSSSPQGKKKQQKASRSSPKQGRGGNANKWGGPVTNVV